MMKKMLIVLGLFTSLTSMAKEFCHFRIVEQKVSLADCSTTDVPYRSGDLVVNKEGMGAIPTVLKTMDENGWELVSGGGHVGGWARNGGYGAFVFKKN